MLIDFRVAFEDFCHDNRIIAEFAKLDPWDSYNDITREILNAEYYGNFYCNDLTKDFYSCDYNRRAKRSIKKAKEYGVEVSIDSKGDTIHKFIELYQHTEEKHKTSKYYTLEEADINQYFTYLVSKCFLINASIENEIITSVFVACGKDVIDIILCLV